MKRVITQSKSNSAIQYESNPWDYHKNTTSNKKPKLQEKKRAVIIIATHGVLFVKADAFMLKQGETAENYYLDNERLAENIETFRTPDNMNIIKYTEVPPGIINIISGGTVDDYTKILYGEELAQGAKIEFLRKLYDPNGIDFLSEDMDRFIADIVNKIKIAKEYDNKYVAKQSNGDVGIDWNRNKWYYDRGYTVYRFGPGEEMANKAFTVTPNDIYGDSNIYISSSADWKMGLLAPNGSHENIYDKIKSEKGLLYNSKYEYINMELLLKFLKDQRYNEIIIFDLTCSALDTANSEDKPAFPRNTRVSGFINAAKNRKISGGKRRYTNKKHKNKRKSLRRNHSA